MDEADLTETERLVWDAFPAGQWVDLRTRPDRDVRAEVIRALLLGVRPSVPGARAGLRLIGAVVTGVLDAGYAEIDGVISVQESRFEDRIEFYGARLRRLNLSRSQLAGLNLNNAGIAGGIQLSGATVTGEVMLAGARVGGALMMNGVTLKGTPRAFDGVRLSVADDLLARNGFVSHGEIVLDGAEISGSVRLAGALLDNPSRNSLNAPGLRVGAVLDLSGGLRAEGTIRLTNAVVGSLLTVSRAVLGDGRSGALDLRNLTAGELVLRPAAPPAGRVDLGYARVGLLRDDPATWPAEINLDGFEYGAIDGVPPVAERLAWLERDPGGFRPRSYRRLAAFYQAAGRDDESRDVLLAGERRSRSALALPGRLWGWLQDVTVGYGYQPRKAVAWLLALLAVGTFVFGALPPRAAEAPKAPEFHAFAYTADLLLPVIDLGQQSAYLPRGWTAWFAYFLIGAGLLFATTAVAAAARRLRRD